MPFVYKVMCDKCDYRSEASWPLWACYQWPLGTASAGHTLEIAQCWVWCNGCRAVRCGEAIPAMERIEWLQAIPVIASAYDDNKKVWATDEIEAALAYARYPRLTNLYDWLTHSKRWGINQSVALHNTLILHREWLLTRESVAHCLTCGGDDLIPFPANFEGEPEPTSHAACGGTITSNQTRKINAKRLLWTTEGELIGPG